MTLLRDVFGHRSEITVFAVGQRVVYEDEVLPSSASLVSSLFALLRRKGADRITLRAGLDPRELAAVLDELTAPDEDPPRLLRASAHVSFEAIVRKDLAAAPPSAAPPQASDVAPGAAAGTLAGVWSGIQDSRDFDADMLGDVVSTLSRSVADSSCTILPLAFVKGYDEYTFVHIVNVGILTMALGEALGFDRTVTQEMGVAALLHDVGKMAVPLEVLNKNGRFTEAEYKTMQVHPVEGARLLLRTRGVPDLAAVVAYEHHVRYDGGGYPKVPLGWRLNLASRICQIADVYDALRTDRPYRPGMPIAKIAKIMKGDAGTYFDPELLGVFFDRVVPRTAGSGTGEAAPAQAPAATGSGGADPV
jgi:HD-GYP domain-containing protein (c-di-GMP phosphodiesterase class II)